MDYATFIGLYLQKCSKSALIKIFIHTFSRYSFLHILLHCAFILQRDVNIKSRIAFWLIILKSAPPPELRWVGSFCEEGPSVRPTDHSRRTEPSLEHCAAAPVWPPQVQREFTCGITNKFIKNIANMAVSGRKFSCPLDMAAIWNSTFSEWHISHPTDLSRRTEPSLEHCAAAAPAVRQPQVQREFTCGITNNFIKKTCKNGRLW